MVKSKRWDSKIRLLQRVHAQRAKGPRQQPSPDLQCLRRRVQAGINNDDSSDSTEAEVPCCPHRRHVITGRIAVKHPHAATPERKHVSLCKCGVLHGLADEGYVPLSVSTTDECQNNYAAVFPRESVGGYAVVFRYWLQVDVQHQGKEKATTLNMYFSHREQREEWVEAVELAIEQRSQWQTTVAEILEVLPKGTYTSYLSIKSALEQKQGRTLTKPERAVLSKGLEKKFSVMSGKPESDGWSRPSSGYELVDVRPSLIVSV